MCRSSDGFLATQLQYAAAMLALLAVTSTKIALCLLIEHINNYGRVKTAIRMFMCFLILESVIGLLAHAFRCSLPTPWRASSPLACAAAQHIYLYNGVMDIITDVMLFILSIAMIWDVKTNTKRKSIVIALFATRILYVVLFTSRAPSFQNSTLPATRRATALILSERFSCPFCRVGTLLRTDFLYESNNFTWEAVVPTVWQQMSCNLSVITACVPSMKTIFDSLSGNVASAGIDAPYNLIAIRGATGFKATALESNTTKRASHVSSYVKRGGLKLGSDSPNEVSCYSGRRMLDLSSRSKDKEGDGTSESVRNLTGGVVVITEEVKVDYESADGQGSCVGSTRSASTAY